MKSKLKGTKVKVCPKCGYEYLSGKVHNCKLICGCGYDEEKGNIPLCYCPKCRRANPITFQDYRKGKIKVRVWSCPFCDTVLNLYGDLQVRKWITEKDLKKMGWERRPISKI